MRLLLAEFDDATQPESWHLRQLGKPATDDDECELLDRSAVPAASTTVAFGTELLFAHRRSRYVFVLEAAVVLHAARDGLRALARVVDALDACFAARASVAAPGHRARGARLRRVPHRPQDRPRVASRVRLALRAALAARRARAREHVRVALRSSKRGSPRVTTSRRRSPPPPRREAATARGPTARAARRCGHFALRFPPPRAAPSLVLATAGAGTAPAGAVD